MNLAELNPVITMESNDVFVASPIFAVAFGWDVKAGPSILTVRTFPFPPVGAVAAINVFA